MTLFLHIQIVSMLFSTSAVVFHVLAAEHAKDKDKSKMDKYRHYARITTALSIFLLGAAYVLALNNLTRPSGHDVQLNAIHLMLILLPASIMEIYIATRE
jgi:preprotein translocase subunit SecY